MHALLCMSVLRSPCICRALVIGILRLQAEEQRSIALALHISGARRNLMFPRPPTLERHRRRANTLALRDCGSARLPSSLVGPGPASQAR